MGLQGQTDLHNAKAQQDKTNGTDQSEDKGRQVVDNGNGVVGGKRRNRSAEDECWLRFGSLSRQRRRTSKAVEYGA